MSGNGHVRSETQVRMSPKISVYLEGLHLTVNVSSRKRDDYLKVLPSKRSKAFSQMWFRKVAPGGV